MSAPLATTSLAAAPRAAELPGDGSFPAGTPIATPQGEATVETLAPGDAVLTLRGPATVRHVATTLHDPATAPTRLLPVLVARDACGEGKPRADLLMPPQQLLYVKDAALPQGALAAVGALVNGTTIRRTGAGGPVAWVRVELETPGVLLAAGLAVAARHDPTAGPAAPILPPGPAIAALRARLATAPAPAAAPTAAPPARKSRAAAEPAPEPAAEAVPEPTPEPAPDLTPDMGPEPDPDAVLRAMAAGRHLAPQAGSTDELWHFTLPPGVTEVVLLSPRGLPATTPAAQRATARRYGVAIRAISVDDTPVALDGPLIGEGFHPAESAGTQTWRWTDGEARLRLAPAGKERRLAVTITDWHALLQRD